MNPSPLMMLGRVEELIDQFKIVIDRLAARGREQAGGAKLTRAATRIKMALAVAIRWEFLLLIPLAARVLSSADSGLPQTLPTLRVRDNEGMITATEPMAQYASSCKEQLRIVVGA